MDLAARQRDSALTQRHVMQLPVFLSSTWVGCYVAMADEVDTEQIRNAVLALGKRLAVPRFDAERGGYDMVEVRQETEFEFSDFGTLEPSPDCPVVNEKVDLLFLPGRAFDPRGNRLGRGKGHIDKMLSQMGPVLKVGLAFPWQLVPLIPVEPHDVPMDAIITADGVAQQGTRYVGATPVPDIIASF